MKRRLLRRAVAHGEITLPAVPGMLEDYLATCLSLFSTLGVHFTPDETAQLRNALLTQLDAAFTASPRSEIVISYDAPTGSRLNYFIKAKWHSVQGAYENWLSTRKPPLFGSAPDARLLALADETPVPAEAPVLDIGAGTGRNALALARRGHPVDAVEMTVAFVEALQADAQRESLPVRLIARDMFAALPELRRDYHIILLSEVVSDFRNTAELRAMFELAASCLAPGGQLLFNIFLAHDGYTPDAAALALGQQCYTSIFTRAELDAARAQLPLTLCSEESVYDYEKAHLPAAAWPPTSWYVDWVCGLDVFDVERQDCPIDLRWLVFRKTG